MDGINPNFKKYKSPSFTIAECKAQLSSNQEILSYLISKSESPKEEDNNFVLGVLDENSKSLKSKKIAISGAPGVGKSSFLDTFIDQMPEDVKVAVLPVDPSSSISKGSILGDKTRMSSLINRKNVYVKPMSSSTGQGGIAPATKLSIDLCVQAGYEYVFIETVGVGQSEYNVKHLVDLFILLLQPGAGDDLQGIKRGIMEMADLYVVTKSDGELIPKAKIAFNNYKSAIPYFRNPSFQWQPSIHLYSSIDNKYFGAIYDKIKEYFSFMNQEGKMESLRSFQERLYFKTKTKDLVFAEMMKNEAFKMKYTILLKYIEEEKTNAAVAIQNLKEILNDTLS